MKLFIFVHSIKNKKSVQYICHPENPWYKLRKNFPEKFESDVYPIPNLEEWFHVTVIVDYPTVNVFINNSDASSLVIEELSSFKDGWVGLWVGNGSEGYFRNLRIIPNNLH